MSVSIVSFLDTTETSKVFKYTVNNHAALLLLTEMEDGDIAFSRNTTGNLNPFVNTKLKGAWQYVSNVWVYANSDLQAKAATQQSEIDSNLEQIGFNDTDILNLQNNKLDKGGYSGNAQDLKDDIDENTWISWIDSAAPRMNQTVIFEPYFVGESKPNLLNGVWSVTHPYTGDYEVEVNCGFSYNSTNNNINIQLLIDGSIIDIPLLREPKDSSGTGIIVPTVENSQLTGVSENSGTDQRMRLSGKVIINRVSGLTSTLKLEFRGEQNNNEATVYDASIVVRKIKNANV